LDADARRRRAPGRQRRARARGARVDGRRGRGGGRVVRLPLTLLLVADALAGGTLATRLDVFDDGDVRAWMPALAASWTGARTTLGARLGVDAVSGATPILTVDAVSSATTFSDVRKQAGVSVDH